MITESVVATITEELDELSSFTHDQWIDLEGLLLSDSGELILTMVAESLSPFLVSSGWWKSRYRVDLLKACLKIRNVESYEVEDRAMIGETMVNTIEISGDTVTIVGCEPVTIRVHVSSLNILLEISDEVVGQLDRWVNRLGWESTRRARDSGSRGSNDLQPMI